MRFSNRNRTENQQQFQIIKAEQTWRELHTENLHKYIYMQNVNIYKRHIFELSDT